MTIRVRSNGLARGRTYSPKAAEIDRAWLLMDADGVSLGDLAALAAIHLRGKHKPIFSPHIDTGDYVIVVNAEKVSLTGDKLKREKKYRHSGYPGGLKVETYGQCLSRSPEKLVKDAIKGMLPRGPLARRQLTKVRIYAGPDHPHEAQQPQVVEVPSRSRSTRPSPNGTATADQCFKVATGEAPGIVATTVEIGDGLVVEVERYRTGYFSVHWPTILSFQDALYRVLPLLPSADEYFLRSDQLEPTLVKASDLTHALEKDLVDAQVIRLDMPTAAVSWHDNGAQGYDFGILADDAHKSIVPDVQSLVAPSSVLNFASELSRVVRNALLSSGAQNV